MLEPELTVAEPQTPRLRVFAIVLGFLMCWPVTWAVANASESGIFSLMAQPISGLIALLLFNIPLRKFTPKLALRQTDLIVCFAIMSVAGAIAGEWNGWVQANLFNFPFQSRTDAIFRDQF